MGDAAISHDHLLARCIKMGGSFPAGVLLFRMHYWSRLAKIERGGHKWMVNSTSWWAEEACATPKQCKTALADLRARGLILAEKHLFRGRIHAFIRLTEKALEGITNEAPPGPTDVSQKGPIIEKGDTEGSIGKEIVEASLDEASPDPGSFSEKEGNMKGLKSVMDVEQAVKAQKVLHKPDTPKALGAIWAKRVNQITGAFVALKGKDFGQLKLFAKACPPGKAEAVLEVVLDDWIMFVKKCESLASAKNTPLIPSVGFLLRYASVAVIFATPKQPPPVKHEATAGPLLTKIVQVTAQLSEPKPDIVTSLEDIWADVEDDEDEK